MESCCNPSATGSDRDIRPPEFIPASQRAQTIPIPRDNPNPSGCFPEFQRYVPSTVTPLSRAAPPAQLPRLGIIPISFVPPGQRIPSSPSLFLGADPWEEGHRRNRECLTRPVLTLGAAEQTPSVGKPNKHRSKVTVISLKSKDNYPSPKLPHPEAPAPARHWN